MFKDIYIVRKLNAANSEPVNRIVRIVETAALHMGQTIINEKDGCDSDTLIVAVGGDGTMLEAMRIGVDKGSIVMGINLGRVGFLTDFTADTTNPGRLYTEMTTILGPIAFSLEGGYDIENRVMVRATTQDFTCVAGNEISISSDKSDAPIMYNLSISNVNAGTHRANSILVSTPTGSTAYAMSAGGALMIPNMKAIQVVPVAPMTLTSRPIIVGDNHWVTIKAWGGVIAVRADGTERHVSSKVHTVDDPYVVKVQCTSHEVRLVHALSWNFFDVLAEKLGWQHK
jgi:NAD+ kinase